MYYTNYEKEKIYLNINLIVNNIFIEDYVNPFFEISLKKLLNNVNIFNLDYDSLIKQNINSNIITIKQEFITVFEKLNIFKIEDFEIRFICSIFNSGFYIYTNAKKIENSSYQYECQNNFISLFNKFKNDFDIRRNHQQSHNELYYYTKFEIDVVLIQKKNELNVFEPFKLNNNYFLHNYYFENMNYIPIQNYISNHEKNIIYLNPIPISYKFNQKLEIKFIEKTQKIINTDNIEIKIKCEFLDRNKNLFNIVEAVINNQFIICDIEIDYRLINGKFLFVNLYIEKDSNENKNLKEKYFISESFENKFEMIYQSPKIIDFNPKQIFIRETYSDVYEKKFIELEIIILNFNNEFNNISLLFEKMETYKITRIEFIIINSIKINFINDKSYCLIQESLSIIPADIKKIKCFINKNQIINIMMNNIYSVFKISIILHDEYNTFLNTSYFQTQNFTFNIEKKIMNYLKIYRFDFFTTKPEFINNYHSDNKIKINFLSINKNSDKYYNSKFALLNSDLDLLIKENKIICGKLIMNSNKADYIKDFYIIESQMFKDSMNYFCNFSKNEELNFYLNDSNFKISKLSNIKDESKKKNFIDVSEKSQYFINMDSFIFDLNLKNMHSFNIVNKVDIEAKYDKDNIFSDDLIKIKILFLIDPSPEDKKIMELILNSEIKYLDIENEITKKKFTVRIKYLNFTKSNDLGFYKNLNKLIVLFDFEHTSKYHLKYITNNYLDINNIVLSLKFEEFKNRIFSNKTTCKSLVEKILSLKKFKIDKNDKYNIEKVFFKNYDIKFKIFQSDIIESLFSPGIVNKEILNYNFYCYIESPNSSGIFINSFYTVTYDKINNKNIYTFTCNLKLINNNNSINIQNIGEYKSCLIFYSSYMDLKITDIRDQNILKKGNFIFCKKIKIFWDEDIFYKIKIINPFFESESYYEIENNKYISNNNFLNVYFSMQKSSYLKSLFMEFDQPSKLNNFNKIFSCNFYENTVDINNPNIGFKVSLICNHDFTLCKCPINKSSLFFKNINSYSIFIESDIFLDYKYYVEKIIFYSKASINNINYSFPQIIIDDLIKREFILNLKEDSFLLKQILESEMKVDENYIKCKLTFLLNNQNSNIIYIYTKILNKNQIKCYFKEKSENKHNSSLYLQYQYLIKIELEVNFLIRKTKLSNFNDKENEIFIYESDNFCINYLGICTNLNKIPILNEIPKIISINNLNSLIYINEFQTNIKIELNQINENINYSLTYFYFQNELEYLKEKKYVNENSIFTLGNKIYLNLISSCNTIVDNINNRIKYYLDCVIDPGIFNISEINYISFQIRLGNTNFDYSNCRIDNHLIIKNVLLMRLIKIQSLSLNKINEKLLTITNDISLKMFINFSSESDERQIRNFILINKTFSIQDENNSFFDREMILNFFNFDSTTQKENLIKESPKIKLQIKYDDKKDFFYVDWLPIDYYSLFSNDPNILFTQKLFGLIISWERNNTNLLNILEDNFNVLNKFSFNENLYKLKLINEKNIIIKNVSFLNRFYYRVSRNLNFILEIEIKNYVLSDKLKFVLFENIRKISFFSEKYEMKNESTYYVFFEIIADKNIDFLNFNNFNPYGEYCIGLYINELKNIINCFTNKIYLEGSNYINIIKKDENLDKTNFQIKTNNYQNNKCLFLFENEFENFHSYNYINHKIAENDTNMINSNIRLNSPIVCFCNFFRFYNLNNYLTINLKLIGFTDNSKEINFLNDISVNENFRTTIINNIEIIESFPKIILINQRIPFIIRIKIRENFSSDLLKIKFFIKLINFNNVLINQKVNSHCNIIKNIFPANQKNNFTESFYEIKCELEDLSIQIMMNSGVYFYDLILDKSQVSEDISIIQNLNDKNLVYLLNKPEFDNLENFNIINNLSNNEKFIKIKFKNDIFELGYFNKIKCRFRSFRFNKIEGIFDI